MTLRDHLSYLMVERTAVLYAVLACGRGLFTIENSASSMMFRSTPILQLRQIVETWTVDFDQCMYGLRPPAPGPSEYIRNHDPGEPPLDPPAG